MLDPIELEPVDALAVQILMDNVTDPTLLDAGPVKCANSAEIAEEPAPHPSDYTISTERVSHRETMR